MISTQYPKVVGIVYECPKYPGNHVHRAAPGESFSCHGTVFVPAELLTPGPKDRDHTR